MTDAYAMTTANILNALPQVLKDDTSCFAIAQAIAGNLVGCCTSAEELRIYAAIDSLPEAVLDILAVDLKIDWWRPDATIEDKRDLVKTCWYVHRHLGTKSAIETAVKSFLGEGQVEEWFDYGGQPHHFRIVGADNAAVNEHFEEFISILRIVQRGSSVLDSVTAKILSHINIYVGMAMHYNTAYEVGCNEISQAILEIFADRDVTVLTDEDGNILMDESGNVLYE